MYIDKSRTYVGIVEENQDPKKLGRCRVRVIDVFDEIPTEDIPWASPWKDLNGNEFNVPDKGKVVTVVFDSGNIYKPEYIYADHFNINLENKVSKMSDDDYLSMKAIFFDHSTQIYRNSSEGLKLDHEYTNINLDRFGNICLNLRDNKSIITLGSVDSDEEAVLGTTFMAWFDNFVDNLIGSQGGPYLDSSGAPVLPNPALISCLAQYEELRARFVSEHVRLPKNKNIIAQRREYINQKGDNWSSTVSENSLTTRQESEYNPSSSFYNSETGQEENYQPLGSATPDNPANYNPGDMLTAVSYDIPTSSLDKSKYQNGRLPDSILKFSKWANGEKKGKWIITNVKGKSNAKLTKEAADAFDALFDLYESSNFPGKSVLTFTDGYRTYAEQQSLASKLPSGYAAKPGTSNHGWGLAVDISGIGTPYTPIKTKKVDRASVFKSPVYQWLFQNAWQFGIYGPESLRDGSGSDEYWHWEYHGSKGQPTIKYEGYKGVFTYKDYKIMRSNNVSSPSDVAFNTYWAAYPDRKKS